MLDYAEEKYGKNFIDDVKALKSVTYMFLPFPIFWALFDQQVSTNNKSFAYVCT
jgi:solute carrier family 15 oligopeptide transporter 1